MVELAVAIVAISVAWALIAKMRARSSPHEAEDPLAGVREPVPHGPPDRSSAVALEEPEDDEEL